MTSAAPAPVVGFDSETPLIGVEHSPLPEPVCFSFAWREDGELRSWVLGQGDDDVPTVLFRLLSTPGARIATAKGAYDFAVLLKRYPRLAPAVYEIIADGRVDDTQIRAKLERIATVGRVSWQDDDIEDKAKGYSLGALMLREYGVDRSADKEGDVWRFRYVELRGLRADAYPEAAYRYAAQDACDTLLVWEAQEKRGPFATQGVNFAADLALQHASAHGLKIDEAEVERLEAIVAEELRPEKLAKVTAAGILRPGDPEAPYANGAQEHVEGCDHFGCDCNGLRPKRKGGKVIGYARKHRKDCERPRCDCPPKMKAATDPSIDTRKLHEHVLAVCVREGLDVYLADKGVEVMGREKFWPQAWSEFAELRDENGKPLYVSTAGEFLHELAAHDPVLYEYRHRKRLDKIRAFLGHLREAIDYGYPYVHPGYDILKETARTSSYGKRKGEELGSLKAPLPSVQIQNVPNPPKVTKPGLEFLDDIEPRGAFIPRPGMIFAGADYPSLELVTTAQVTLDLFGFSRHADIIRGGRNCHTYLGAQIAHKFAEASPEAEKFLRSRAVRAAERKGDRVAIADEFAKRADGTKAERKFFKRYRTTAKPVGLGFPGMLGPRKMAYSIFPGYNLEATEADCRAFRELWLEAYPEMALYFEHVKRNLRQPDGSYAYESWGGFARANCTINAAANGVAMQTPGVFGAKCALALLDREIKDPSRGSILYGRFALALFVHDEVFGETPDDETAPHVAGRVARVMEDGLRYVCPDIPCEVEEVLTDRWLKDAEPVFDETGQLGVWRAPQAELVAA